MQQSGPEGKGHQQNASCKGQSITIGDGRQKSARQQRVRGVGADPCNARRSEGRQRDIKEMKGKVRKQRGVQVFIPLRKRRMRRCRAPCPKRPRQTQKGGAWPGSRKERAFHQDADY